MSESKTNDVENGSSGSKGGNSIPPCPIVECKGDEVDGSSGSKNRCSQAKKWCFTWNNYNEEDIERLTADLKLMCDSYIVGMEVGEESSTPHLQGFVELKKKARPLTVFPYKKDEKFCMRWFKCKGSKKQNIAYCEKDGDVILRFNCPSQKKYVQKIEKFFPWQTMILDELRKKADDRTINWFWEEQGCCGKTTFQKYVFTHFDEVVVLSGKGADMKNGILQYMRPKGKPDDEKETPKIVLINIPRVSSDFISIAGIEEVKDMFFFSPKYEGGMICGENPHVYVFANCPPPYEKMSEDRWRVVNIRGEAEDDITIEEPGAWFDDNAYAD